MPSAWLNLAGHAFHYIFSFIKERETSSQAAVSSYGELLTYNIIYISQCCAFDTSLSRHPQFTNASPSLNMCRLKRASLLPMGQGRESNTAHVLQVRNLRQMEASQEPWKLMAEL